MNWQTKEPPHCPTCHCGIQCPACESRDKRIAELEADVSQLRSIARQSNREVGDLIAERDRLRVALEALPDPYRTDDIPGHHSLQSWLWERYLPYYAEARKAREECK